MAFGIDNLKICLHVFVVPPQLLDNEEHNIVIKEKYYGLPFPHAKQYNSQRINNEIFITGANLIERIREEYIIERKFFLVVEGPS